MKTIITFIIGVLLCSNLHAKCGSSGLYAFPKGGTISQNTCIVLEGYFRSESIIDSLNHSYPIYLLSDKHKVKLNVKTINKGDFGLTQAILVPDEKLTIGETYVLTIDNLDEDSKELLYKWNTKDRAKEPIAWEVIKGNDLSKPKLRSAPKLIDSKTTHYGCGPSVFVEFKLSIDDESEVLIKTELIDISSGKSTIYILPMSESNKLNVGHGMCSGAFKYEREKSYKIRFSPIDISGNDSDTWTDWIAFESPRK